MSFPVFMYTSGVACSSCLVTLMVLDFGRVIMIMAWPDLVARPFRSPLVTVLWVPLSAGGWGWTLTLAA